MSDRKWEIEEDARVLKKAAEIKLDPKKLKPAFQQLKKDAAAANKALVDVERLFKKR